MTRKATTLALKFTFLLSILWLPTCLLSQQSSGIRPPALGYIFDSGSRNLKPILGVPGASIIGAPVNINLEFAHAVASPRQDYAILLAGPNHDVNLLPFLGSDSRARLIDGAVPGPDHIAFSPLGSTVLLYRATDSLFQIITGLPASPVIAHEIRSSSPGGDLKSMA